MWSLNQENILRLKIIYIDHLGIFFDGKEWETLGPNLREIIEDKTCSLVMSNEHILHHFTIDMKLVIEQLTKLDFTNLPTDSKNFLQIWCPDDYWMNFLNAYNFVLHPKQCGGVDTISDSLISSLRTSCHCEYIK